MVEQISPRQFHDSAGAQDWRMLSRGACAYFRTGSFAAGAELVDAIAELAEAANHHPDIDLRYAGVTVRLITHEVGGLSTRDAELARQISEAARELDIRADPSAVQDIDLAIDAVVAPQVMPFWRAVLGYKQVGDEHLEDRRGRGPSIRVQELDAQSAERGRMHAEVWVPHDAADARIEAAIAAGGHLVAADQAPARWTLADAEGNEVDVATWMGR